MWVILLVKVIKKAVSYIRGQNTVTWRWDLWKNLKCESKLKTLPRKVYSSPVLIKTIQMPATFIRNLRKFAVMFWTKLFPLKFFMIQNPVPKQWTSCILMRVSIHKTRSLFNMRLTRGLNKFKNRRRWLRSWINWFRVVISL
jgi:hypothetical protein